MKKKLRDILFILFGKRGKKPDGLSIKTIEHPFKFKKFKDNPLNNLIVEAVNRMGGVGEDAETEYQAIIKKLHAEAEEAAPIIMAEYEDLPETRYLDRWALMHLLVEIEQVKTLQFLDKIVSTPLPPEKSKKPSATSTQAEEVMIRSTAIKAITRMADKKHEEAIKLLLKHTKHNVFSIKRAAIQNYLEVGENEPKKELLKILPKEDHFILDIKRLDVKEVPQPKPKDDLKQTEKIVIPGKEPYRPPRIKKADNKELKEVK